MGDLVRDALEEEIDLEGVADHALDVPALDVAEKNLDYFVVVLVSTVLGVVDLVAEVELGLEYSMALPDFDLHLVVVEVGSIEVAGERLLEVEFDRGNEHLGVRVEVALVPRIGRVE